MNRDTRPRGGIGRHAALKMLWTARSVPVRFWSGLQINNIDIMKKENKVYTHKCTNCGKRYSYTKDQAKLDWDFSGPNFLITKCPHCGIGGQADYA